MRLSGIHLLLTYKCNASCGHCFLSCGPTRSGVMSAQQAEKYLDDATDIGSINHVFIEGGEPFLYPDILVRVVRGATDRGFWVGALTNGFWASTPDSSRERLLPLVEAGLDYLGVSTDAWHQEFVAVEMAERAVSAAQSLGLESELMVCGGGPDSDAALERLLVDGFAVEAGSVACRGRAGESAVCAAERYPWEELGSCTVSFDRASRVHIGPFGDVHVCQGLLMEGDARQESLASILGRFTSAAHPICEPLATGGPAALARLAAQEGFKPRRAYADACQLCFEARRFLLGRFSGYLGPVEVYQVPAAG